MTARKDPSQRARRNAENRPFRVIEHVRVGQPELPPGFPYDGKRYKWPPITKTWWDHWSDTTLNDGFTVHDWDYLMDTAVIHAKHWLGLDMKAGGELRQRLAKFGVTPEDRARLRIVMVDADTAEEKAAKAAALNAKVPTTGNARRLTAIPGFDVSTEDTG